MKRVAFAVVLLMLFLVPPVLGGCAQALFQGGKQQSAPKSENGKDAMRTASKQDPEGIGESAEVGPFLVTLNDVGPYSSDQQADNYYTILDLTLKNESQDTLDASSADYLLRDEQGYSFDAKSISGQRPRPEGQVTPDGKASGEVAFDLGAKPVKGPLTLFVSLPEQPDAPPAAFKFEVALQKKEKQTQPESEVARENSTDSESVTEPGYNVIEDPSGTLSVEVPSSWSSETGADSEGEGGLKSWSYYAGEYITTSITTARSLDAWYGIANKDQGSGIYMVSSETLAQQYTDEELIFSLLHEKKSTNCTAGPYQDLDRPPYTGKIQSWFNCNGLGTTYHVFAAAPEGRECVVVGGARVVEGAADADREAVDHIIDSFEVDCGPGPNAPSVAEQQAEQAAEEEVQDEAPEQQSQDEQPAPEPAAEPTEAGVVVRVTGDPGQQFSGALGNIDATRTVDGTTPQDFPLEGVDTGLFSGDVVSANAQKMSAGAGTLTVQILVDGEVVKEATTTAEYGVAQAVWSTTE